MIAGDFVVIAVLAAVIAFVVFRTKVFTALTLTFPYSMGALKFGVLATLGSQVKLRITEGHYEPEKLIGQAFAWAITGMLITWAFPVFGKLGEALWTLRPFRRYQGKFSPKLLHIAKSFTKSLSINLIFAWPMMLFHTFLETLIVEQKVMVINWDTWGIPGFIVTTIVLFWLPAHTITFSQKREWQILIAAFLSIVLGILLAFAT